MVILVKSLNLLKSLQRWWRIQSSYISPQTLTSLLLFETWEYMHFVLLRMFEPFYPCSFGHLALLISLMVHCSLFAFKQLLFSPFELQEEVRECPRETNGRRRQENNPGQCFHREIGLNSVFNIIVGLSKDERQTLKRIISGKYLLIKERKFFVSDRSFFKSLLSFYSLFL